MNASSTDIGIISDTHGLLRPEAIEALAGSELIIHAGDVGKPSILRDLEQIAPVVAVRGNIDRDPSLASLPLTQVVSRDQGSFYVIHILEDLDLDPKVAGLSGVIFGHSHRPEFEERNGVMYINPGSAGPRRFRLPITLSRLRWKDERWDHQLIELVP